MNIEEENKEEERLNAFSKEILSCPKKRLIEIAVNEFFFTPSSLNVRHSFLIEKIQTAIDNRMVHITIARVARNSK